jgi:hypothetical protein
MLRTLVDQAIYGRAHLSARSLAIWADVSLTTDFVLSPFCSKVRVGGTLPPFPTPDELALPSSTRLMERLGNGLDRFYAPNTDVGRSMTSNIVGERAISRKTAALWAV